ncbi:hypothetical protein PCC8801_4530 (plasmid) [Rippkaea orientalis PCC 8801]|uniref:Uncharacterized protein n=1 Tax=Rippkaea orientalis (strain PCC 8801 / RF-1) TaxID=41431 RepID=B7K6L8_RIPO1|nr:hypothetical protein [Rippkaea orientalis]ACK68440.1 hypothetical protein PCC8801_4530 [Rippkaea orientalis PCC 8801]
MNPTPDPTPVSFQEVQENGKQVTTEDLAEVIEQFEQYRERLVSETMITAQRAKLPKKTAMAQIEPELAKIDAALLSLRQLF